MLRHWPTQRIVFNEPSLAILQECPSRLATQAGTSTPLAPAAPHNALGSPPVLNTTDASLVVPALPAQPHSGHHGILDGRYRHFAWLAANRVKHCWLQLNWPNFAQGFDFQALNRQAVNPPPRHLAQFLSHARLSAPRLNHHCATYSYLTAGL